LSNVCEKQTKNPPPDLMHSSVSSADSKGIHGNGNGTGWSRGMRFRCYYRQVSLITHQVFVLDRVFSELALSQQSLEPFVFVLLHVEDMWLTAQIPRTMALRLSALWQAGPMQFVGRVSTRTRQNNLYNNGFRV
jgi:hypothetical protein